MEEDIFKKYDELFCPPKIKELDIELDKLDKNSAYILLKEFLDK